MKKSGLSRRALLVAVNISQWTAKKIDEKATNTANAAHNADRSAGNYHKRLLPGSVELLTVHTISSQARAYYYEQTLPWMGDGTRIISAKNYMKFSREMAKFKSEFSVAVDEFVNAYPRLKAEAAKSLGGLYEVSDYPTNIRDKFNIEVSYLPLPDVKDFRVQISEAEKKEFQRKMARIESEAMKEVWTRIHGVVKNAAEKLSNPGAIFRDSLLENITEMTALLPMLNISNDPALDSAAKEIGGFVSKLSPETLRKNPEERDLVSKKLSEIESSMSAFMGVSK